MSIYFDVVQEICVKILLPNKMIKRERKKMLKNFPF